LRSHSRRNNVIAFSVRRPNDNDGDGDGDGDDDDSIDDVDVIDVSVADAAATSAAAALSASASASSGKDARYNGPSKPVTPLNGGSVCHWGAATRARKV
jgi:hypothetical protein